MKNDINLIDVGARPKTGKQDVVLLSTICMFTLVFVVTVLVLFYSFLQKSHLSQVNTTVNSLQAKMSILSSEKNKILTVSNRLGSIKNIISSRHALDSKMQAIISFIPSNFSVKNFTASDKQVSMVLSSTSLADFDNLLEVRIPQITKNKALGIDHVDIGSFTNDQGEYSLLITFYFMPLTK